MPLAVVLPFCKLAACRMFVASQMTSRRGFVAVDCEVGWVVVWKLWMLKRVLRVLILQRREGEVLVVVSPAVGPVEAEGVNVLRRRRWVQAFQKANLGTGVVESSPPISVERLCHWVEQEC